MLKQKQSIKVEELNCPPILRTNKNSELNMQGYIIEIIGAEKQEQNNINLAKTIQH